MARSGFVMRAAMLASSVVSTTLAAQTRETLEWVLPADQNLQFVAEETTDTETQVGEKPLKIQARSRLEMTWKPDRVGRDPDQLQAAQRISITLDRIAWRFAAPGVPPEQYDSRNLARDDAHAAPNEPLAGLIGSEIWIWILPAGELSDVKLSEAARRAVQDSQRPAALLKLLSAESFEQLLQSFLIPLPGTVAPGQSWTRSRRTIASLGVLDQTDRFQYRGKTTDGKWRRVDWTTSVRLDGHEPATDPAAGRRRPRSAVRLRGFSQHGVLWVAEAPALLIRSQVTQLLTTESADQGVESVQTRSQRVLKFGLRLTPKP